MAGSVTRTTPHPVQAKTPTSLRLQKGRVSYDQWVSIGRQLAEAQAGVAWWIGDWAAFGQGEGWAEEDESQRGGSKYAAAIEISGLDYQTVRNYAWVADNVPLSRRRDTLSFGHHAEVASLLPHEQDHWLRLAEAEGLSVMALRRELQRGQVGGRSSSAVSGNVRIAFSIPQSRSELWQEAAQRHDQALDEWIVATLNEAAASEAEAEAA